MKYFYSAILVFFAFSTFAQQNENTNLIVELMPFMSINSNELGKVHQKYMSQKTPIGVAAGLGVRANRRAFHFMTTAGLRYNTQTLAVHIDNSKTNIDYTNLDFYWKLMFGLQVDASTGSNIIFKGGFMTFLSLKNKGGDRIFLTTPYTDPLTGEQLNNLNGIYEKNGYPKDPSNSGSIGPLLLNMVLSMGYETTNLLPNHRKCGVNLEFSTRLTASNNRGMLYKFDSQRNLNDANAFIDNRTSLGLNFYVALTK